MQVSGDLVVPTSPIDGCEQFDDEKVYGKIVLIVRGGCMFIHKVHWALCVWVGVTIMLCLRSSDPV